MLRWALIVNLFVDFVTNRCPLVIEKGGPAKQTKTFVLTNEYLEKELSIKKYRSL